MIITQSMHSLMARCATCLGFIGKWHRKAQKSSKTPWQINVAKETATGSTTQIQLKHNYFCTCLFVEHNFILKLLALLQGVINAEYDAFTGLGSVQEFTGTALLHDLRSGEACELTEAIGAVDDGKTLRHLSIGKDEIAVCRSRGRKT